MTFAAAVPLAAATGWQRWWVTLLRQPPGRGRHKHRHGRANCQELRRILNLCVCASSPCVLLVCVCVTGGRTAARRISEADWRRECDTNQPNSSSRRAERRTANMQMPAYVCMYVCVRVCMCACSLRCCCCCGRHFPALALARERTLAFRRYLRMHTYTCMKMYKHTVHTYKYTAAKLSNAWS